jgi:hypothetical protein
VRPKPAQRECRYLETLEQATELYEQLQQEKLDPEKGYELSR